MTTRTNTWSITGTSPAAANQAAVGRAAVGLDQYDSFFVTAILVGATGGTLDVYLQRRVDDAGTIWVDFAHFPQLAAGAALIRYAATMTIPPAAVAVVVGTTDNAGTTGAPALAVNTIVGGHPGDAVRMVCVAGVSTTAGAVATVLIKGVKRSI